MTAASFTERFDFRPLHALDADDSLLALVQPATEIEVRWDGAAAEMVTDAAGGSPYLLQRMGDEVWQVAAPQAGVLLSVDDARVGLAEVAESLGTGMFPGRFDRASEREQDLLVAMAQVVDDRGVALVRDLETVLGRGQRSFSVQRQSLIVKGLVEPRGRGELAFTMPGFDVYLRQRADAAHLDAAAIARQTDARRLPGTD